MPSYLEVAAKEKLKLYEEQLYKNAGADAALSRNLKDLKRKDFAQQIQPITAQVDFQAGKVTKFQAPTRWGQMGASRAGRVGVNIKAAAPRNTAKPTTITKTGSMTVLSPELEWTTEGYMANNKYLPQDTFNKRTVDKGDPLYINLSPKGIMVEGQRLLNKSKELNNKKGLKPISTPNLPK